MPTIITMDNIVKIRPEVSYKSITEVIASGPASNMKDSAPLLTPMGGYRRRLKDQRILVILHTESKPSFSIRVAVWSKFSLVACSPRLDEATPTFVMNNTSFMLSNAS